MFKLRLHLLRSIALAGALNAALTHLSGSASAVGLPPYVIRQLPSPAQAIDGRGHILSSTNINGRVHPVVLRPDGTHWLPGAGLPLSHPETDVTVAAMNRLGHLLLLYPFAVRPLHTPPVPTFNRNGQTRYDEGSNVLIRVVARNETKVEALPDFPFRLDYCTSLDGFINGAGQVVINYDFWNGDFLVEGVPHIRSQAMVFRSRRGWKHYPAAASLPQSKVVYLRDDGSATGIAFTDDTVTGSDGVPRTVRRGAPCLFRPEKPALVLTPLRGTVMSLNERGDAVLAVPGEPGADAIPFPGNLTYIRRGETPRALGRLAHDDGVAQVRRVGDCITYAISDDGTLTYTVATEVAPGPPGNVRQSSYVKCDVIVAVPGHPDDVIRDQVANKHIGRYVPGDGLWLDVREGNNEIDIIYQGGVYSVGELNPLSPDWLDLATLNSQNIQLAPLPLNSDGNPFLYRKLVDLSSSPSLATEPWQANFFPAGAANPGMHFVIEPSRAVVRELEVTQVVQDWSQTIPLVAGKVTFVRAHIEALHSIAVGQPARGRLRGFDSGVELPDSPLAPVNRRGRGTVSRDAAATREQSGLALDFVLPPSWCNSRLELLIESAGAEFASRSRTVRFIQVPAARIEFFPLTILDNGASFRTGDDQAILLHDQILSMMPVARIDSGPLRRDLSLLADDLDHPDDLGTVNARLRQILLADADSRNLNSAKRQSARQLGFHIAVTDLVQDLGGEADGVGDGIPANAIEPGAVATITGQSSIPNRGVHELAHLLGQVHATTDERIIEGEKVKLGFCDEKAPTVSPNFPFFDHVPGQTHKVPLLGPTNVLERMVGIRLDTDGRPELLSPLDHFELMGYCEKPDRWISGHTYANCLQAISEFFGASARRFAPDSARADGTAEVDRLLVRGSVNLESGAVRLEPCLPLGQGPAPDPLASGELLIRFIGSNGLVLQDWPFGVGAPVEQERVKSFTLVVPRPVGTAGLQALGSGQVLASLTTSAHAPSVQLLTPNGGPVPAGADIHVAWHAEDLDGDPLRFALSYTVDDGATWRILVPDTDATSLNIAASSLIGSATARFQVVATDGLNFAEDVSDALVQVTDPPPVVLILTPSSGQRYHLSETLMLRASGHSASTGFDSFQEATWASDRAGVLGSGLRAQIPVASLAPGFHQITVTVRDASGQFASNTVAIQVDEFAAAEMLTPELDGDTGTLILPVLLDPGVLATLHRSSNLLDWTAVTNEFATGERVNFDRPIESAHRFYRVSTDGIAPVITEGVRDIKLADQTAISLEASVEGTPPVSFHWLHNGLPMAGPFLLPSLVVLNPGPADLGTYALVASNRFGQASSQPFTVTVAGEIPSFTRHPEDICFFSFLESARFTVATAGTPAPALQWLFNGSPLAGENGSELSIFAPSLSQLGEYQVVASNALGSATSQVGRLLICPPEITSQPPDACIRVGTSRSLLVGVSSFLEPAYQWYFNGAVLAGATNLAVSFLPFQTTNAGNYFVTVTGTGLAQTSRVAQVTVCP